MSGTFKIGDKTVVSHSDITDKTTLTADEAVISGSSSGDLVRITQTGSGNSLVVEDETNPDSSPFVINNNGRLLLGTTSEVATLGLNGGLQIFGDNASKGSLSLRRGSDDAQGVFVTIVKSRSSTDGTSAVCSNGDEIGRIVFQAADGNDLASSAAEISAIVDGTCGTDDTPGRLVFSTTADGASSPTERMRIDSSGNVLIGINSSTSEGEELQVWRQGGEVASFLRYDDGTLLNFRTGGGAIHGTISISGTTCSYNSFAGSHWSQLKDGSKSEILCGTVMEAIDELVKWPNEPPNTNLCKVKISDNVGTKKVYGVFMGWDKDWTATNDMLVTALGAFLCRVNNSEVVQQGDLLESNGDGTARVQSDDVVRSSTIGKVTSTFKTLEYDDGSYCVPTVLYCG